MSRPSPGQASAVDHEDAYSSSPDAPPALSALFLIRFDLKVGYTIAWKRASGNPPLEGIVEFKSLPSGLHNVKQDLVYFVHGHFAGISAFANAAAQASERNARFVAVGALVPLKDGRLGRSWLHAESLKQLATKLAIDPEQTQLLEEYWERYRLQDGHEADVDTTATNRKGRTLSTASGLIPDEHFLSPMHPALSVLELLDTFGPLTFAIHREALLRKRLLLVTRAPVHAACDFVYDFSILSSLPLSLAPLLRLPSPSLSRIRSLFTLGIHDIPYMEKVLPPTRLSQTENGTVADAHGSEASSLAGEGWIACTTDEILAVKTSLFDILIEMPPVHSKRWPIIKFASDGTEIRATQRDVRRYRALLAALGPVRNSLNHGKGGESDGRLDNDSDDERTHLLYPSSDVDRDCQDGQWTNGDEEKVVEPATWSALAYSSFMWWASAGEKEDLQMEEDDLDLELLSEVREVAARLAEEARYKDDDEENASRNTRDTEHEATPANKDRDAQLEMAVIAYFHRITKRLFQTAAHLFDDDQDGDEASESNVEDAKPMVNLDGSDLRSMDLDVWSTSSRDFVTAFASMWFDRDVEVHGMGIECCGVRIC